MLQSEPSLLFTLGVCPLITPVGRHPRPRALTVRHMFAPHLAVQCLLTPPLILQLVSTELKMYVRELYEQFLYF